jgi:hypothetical protein
MSIVTVTLEKEIARLYQSGKSPVSYVSTITTEVLAMLYLANKHKIHQPSLDQICRDYLQYGRLTARQKVIKEAPSFYCHELALYYDKKDNLIHSNSEEYYAAFYWKIRKTIDANPGKKIFCTFMISMYVEEKIDNGHSEMVLYDPALNILEHVDSNNLPKQCSRMDRGYFACCEICNSIVKRVADQLKEKPIYVNNNDIYSGYDWGIQSLEASSDKLTEAEKEGYCLMWSILFGDLAITFPEYSVKEIVETFMKKAGSKQNAETCKNDYLLLVIRGYVATIAKELEVTFTNEESKHTACVMLARNFQEDVIKKMCM